MFKKFRERYKRWKLWASRNLNGPVYKFLVLIGLAVSPTFEQLYRFEMGPSEDGFTNDYEPRVRFRKS